MYKQDSKYIAPTVHRELSLDGLAAWLETQNPDTKYDYENPRDCLACRYLKATGMATDPQVSPYQWKDNGGTGGYIPFAAEVESAVHGLLHKYGTNYNDRYFFKNTEQTYAGALARIHELREAGYA